MVHTHNQKEVVVVSPTTTAVVPAIAVDTTISGKPTKAEVLDAIERETGCTRALAGSVISWVGDIVDHQREVCYKHSFFPTSSAMSGLVYSVFDAIVGHGKASTPGSAHQLLEAYLLDPTKDETGIFHDNRDEQGSPSYCRVQVAIGVIR